MKNAEYYVYVHKRASDGLPFYYGRGKDRRAWEPYRNPWHANVVEKHGLIVEILQKGLTRDEGSALECKLIAAGRLAGEPLVNLTRGGDGQDPEISRKIGLDSYARKVGIHAPGVAKLGGHAAGIKVRDLKIGFHDPKYSGAGGRRTAELKVGAFAPGVRAKVGAKVGKITGKLPWWHLPLTGQQKRAYQCPGEGFLRGMGPRKPGVGAKISASKKGYKHTEEAKQKMRTAKRKS